MNMKKVFAVESDQMFEKWAADHSAVGILRPDQVGPETIIPEGTFVVYRRSLRSEKVSILEKLVEGKDINLRMAVDLQGLCELIFALLRGEDQEETVADFLVSRSSPVGSDAHAGRWTPPPSASVRGAGGSLEGIPAGVSPQKPETPIIHTEDVKKGDETMKKRSDRPTMTQICRDNLERIGGDANKAIAVIKRYYPNVDRKAAYMALYWANKKSGKKPKPANEHAPAPARIARRRAVPAASSRAVAPAPIKRRASAQEDGTTVSQRLENLIAELQGILREVKALEARQLELSPLFQALETAGFLYRTPE